MTQNRITNSPRTGKGDMGVSNLISGLRVRKSSEICSLQNELARLRTGVAKILATEKKYQYLFPAEDICFLTCIRDTVCNTISASVYFKFEDERYTVNDGTLIELETRIDFLSSSVTDAPEFVVFTELHSLQIEEVTTTARKVENYFWKVVDILNGDFTTEYEDIVQNTAKFLNAFSDYLFCLNRWDLMRRSKAEAFWKNPTKEKI